jgi:hypothetical protein
MDKKPLNAALLLGLLGLMMLSAGCTTPEETNNQALDASRAAQAKAMKGGALPFGGPPHVKQ